MPLSKTKPHDKPISAPADSAPDTGRQRSSADPLAEPIAWRFFKNRKHDIVVVSLSSYEGRNLVDVRQHFTNKEGKDQPTSRGVAMVVRRLPDLARAVNAALAKAQELGLIGGGDE